MGARAGRASDHRMPGGEQYAIRISHADELRLLGQNLKVPRLKAAYRGRGNRERPDPGQHEQEQQTGGVRSEVAFHIGNKAGRYYLSRVAVHMSLVFAGTPPDEFRLELLAQSIGAQGADVLDHSLFRDRAQRFLKQSRELRGLRSFEVRTTG